MALKCAFLGLGVMGYPMAGHLTKSGYDVTVYNRTTSKSEKWVEEYGGSFAKTPVEAAKDQDVIFACVGNDDDLREVTLGKEGAFHGMSDGSIFVDHTTASATIARELFKEASKINCDFLDAPVSGGEAGAVNGQLTIMIGGCSGPFSIVKPILKSYAKSLRLMGEPGAGQLTKMVNQVTIAGLLQGLSEGIHFAKQAGLDVDAVIDVIKHGAAGSWQMENRAATMNKGEYDFGFAVDWMRKDLGLVFDEAERNGAKLDVAKIIDGYYKEVQDMGGNRWDTSSLLTRLVKD